MTTVPDHDAYLAAAPEPFAEPLRRLRDLLARTLPEAEEIVAYDMPGFRVDGTVVASYAAFTRQCGLYVLPPAIVELTDEIAVAGLRATKSGVTFTPRRPIPDELVERLALASRRAAAA